MVVVSFPTDQFVDRLNVRATESHERGASRTTERAANDTSEEDVSAGPEPEAGDSDASGLDNNNEDETIISGEPSLISDELTNPPTLLSSSSLLAQAPSQSQSPAEKNTPKKSDASDNKSPNNPSVLEDASLNNTIDKALLEINGEFNNANSTSSVSKSPYELPTGYKPTLIAHNGLNGSGANGPNGANSYLFMNDSSKNKSNDKPISSVLSAGSSISETSSLSSSAAMTAAANAANQFYTALADDAVKSDTIHDNISAVASAALPCYIKRKKRRISSREAQGTPMNPDTMLVTGGSVGPTVMGSNGANPTILASSNNSGLRYTDYGVPVVVAPATSSSSSSMGKFIDPSRGQPARDPLTVYDETKFCRECNLLFDTRLLLRSHRSYYHSFKVSTTIKVLGNIPGTFIGDQVTAKRDEDGRFPCPVRECTFKTKNRKTWCGHIRKVPHAPNPQLPGTSVVSSANQFSSHNMNPSAAVNTSGTVAGGTPISEINKKSKVDNIKPENYIPDDPSLNDNQLMCEKCDKHLSSPWMVDSHMANYHSRTASVTLKATSEIPGAVEGDVVTTVRNPEGFLDCPIDGCTFRAKNKDTWRNHVARKPHMGGSKNLRFKPMNDQDIREHVGAIHGGAEDMDGRVLFKCKKCDLVVDTEARLENHMDFLHGKRVSVRLKESSKIPGKRAGDVIRTERTADGLLFCPIFDCHFQTRHRATWCSHVQSAQHL